MKDGLTRRQLLAITTVAFLAPALRLLPGWSAELAGRVAWLSPAAALPALLIMELLLCAILKNRRPGEGLAAMLLRALGRPFGQALLALWALWLTFYAGFILRSGAERFIVTLYPNSSPAFFACAMWALALLAALGPVRAVGRCAEVFRPALVLVLALVLVFALRGWSLEPLLPVRPSDAVPVLLGAIPAADVGVFILVTVSFLEGASPAGESRGRSFLWWSLGACAFLVLLSALCLGRFGAELTGKLSQPFFVLVRNTELFSSLDRLEAFVTTLWVFPDLVLVSAALHAGSDCARRAMGFPRTSEKPDLTDLGNGRIAIWLMGAAALAAALTMAPTAFELEVCSRRVVPALNIGFSLTVPLALAVGKLRKKV